MGLEAANDQGESELLAGDPIPAAPSKNPTIDPVMLPTGALNFAYAWIALLALSLTLV